MWATIRQIDLLYEKMFCSICSLRWDKTLTLLKDSALNGLRKMREREGGNSTVVGKCDIDCLTKIPFDISVATDWNLKSQNWIESSNK